MKRIAALFIATAISLPMAAQPVPDDGRKIVASINSETLTLARLTELYNTLPLQTREQYEKSGGKAAYLDNYLRKRLVVQEAMKQGFDKKPEVLAAMDAARDSALFERYVREVVAPTVVPESAVRADYDANASRYARPEQVRARHIIVSYSASGPAPKTKEEAEDRIERIARSLEGKLAAAPEEPDARRAVLIRAFDEAARTFSEDGVAKQGGDLGWFARGAMDANFEKVAWATPPGTISAPFETPFGYHIVLVEAIRPAGNTPYEEVRAQIREQLLSKHTAEVMQIVAKMTTELRNSSRVAIYPENIR